MEIPSKGLPFIPHTKKEEMLVVSLRKKKFKILASRVKSLLTALIVSFVVVLFIFRESWSYFRRHYF